MDPSAVNEKLIRVLKVCEALTAGLATVMMTGRRNSYMNRMRGFAMVLGLALVAPSVSAQVKLYSIGMNLEG